MLTTVPPPTDVVLYDGHCRICVRGAAQLRRWIRPATTELASFREPGVLERFPGLSMARCERAIQLVRADGIVLEGVKAMVEALRHRPVGLLAKLYYLPGLRQLTDVAYRCIARRRFDLGGRTGQCTPEGTCHLHVR